MNDKTQLRQYYKALRRRMSAAEKLKYDEQIAQAFLNSELYKNCDELLVYVSLDIEVGTLDIISQALREKTVLCPRCISGQNIMEFYNIKNMDELCPGSYGILEPKTDGKAEKSFSDNSLCIVPGLSYDRNGYRLGFGKGFYDRFLSAFNGKSVGLCYDSCLCQSLPCDDFDKCVDYLITQSGCAALGLRKEEIYG